jgi:hypothetical protein
VHYIIDADGARVGQFLHETDTAWHAGNFEYNKHSVGIEHVGFAANTAGYADGLYETSAKLVADIRTRWTVPIDRTHIIGHYQIPDGNRIAEGSAPCGATLDACETSANYGGASNHRDPGYYWMWCQYMERLGGSCTCNDAYSLWNCTTDHTEAVRCSGGQVQIDHCTAGCDSMPVGVDDVCRHATAPDGGMTPPSNINAPRAAVRSGQRRRRAARRWRWRRRWRARRECERRLHSRRRRRAGRGRGRAVHRASRSRSSCSTARSSALRKISPSASIGRSVITARTSSDRS